MPAIRKKLFRKAKTGKSVANQKRSNAETKILIRSHRFSVKL